MIPRVFVDVRVPRACYDALGDAHAIQALLRRLGLFPAQAQEVRWRVDVETAGYVVSYTVPVPPGALETQP